MNEMNEMNAIEMNEMNTMNAMNAMNEVEVEKEKAKKFLETIEKESVHGKNILAKFDNVDLDLIKNYKRFYETLNNVNNDLDDKIQAFIDYKKYAHKKNKIYKFSSQSKFEPTILEEFIYQLFKEFKSDEIKVGSAKAYTNIYFSPKSFNDFKNNIPVKVNVKDQDVAIYKEIELFGKVINIPIVSFECKTYLDKTMLEGAIATAEKIKNGNPYAKYYLITETYEVKYDVDPFFSRIDNIFVLRKSKRRHQKPIDKKVIKNLYYEVKDFMLSQWSNPQFNIECNGCIW